MMYKHAQWRWSNVLVLSVLLMIPMVMCAMEQEENVGSKGGFRYSPRNIVNYLMKKGPYTNAADKYGNTALMQASSRGNKKIVDSLIKAGAHINAVDDYGLTALMVASKKGHKKIVKSLIKAGADVNIGRTTALMEGSRQSDSKKEIVDSLIKAGANINAVESDGSTALIWASQNAKKEIVDSLIKAGADVNIISNHYWTALMGASRCSHEGVVDSLIKGGAHINFVNKYGSTALMVASRWGKNEVVYTLVERGANPYIENKEGKNALDIAQDVGRQVLRKNIIKKRKEYVIKKYREYLIDRKNRMEDLAVLLQKRYDWYKPYCDEDKGKHDEQEVEKSYSFSKDIAGVIAKFTHGISDDEWAQMRRLENEQQSLK